MKQICHKATLPYKHEEENKTTGMTARAGLPVYLDCSQLFHSLPLVVMGFEGNFDLQTEKKETPAFSHCDENPILVSKKKQKDRAEVSQNCLDAVGVPVSSDLFVGGVPPCFLSHYFIIDVLFPIDLLMVFGKLIPPDKRRRRRGYSHPVDLVRMDEGPQLTNGPLRRE